MLFLSLSEGSKLFIFLLLQKVMAIYKIRKRNGTIVSFEKEKIFQALGDARNTVGEPKHLDIESLTNEIIQNTESLIKTQKKSI